MLNISALRICARFTAIALRLIDLSPLWRKRASHLPIGGAMTELKAADIQELEIDYHSTHESGDGYTTKVNYCNKHRVAKYWYPPTTTYSTEMRYWGAKRWLSALVR